MQVHASLDSLRQQEEVAKAAMAGSAGGVQDLASIQKVVDALPELNRQKREVAKHVAICSDLSRRVAPMFAVSEAQQELLMTATVPGAPLPEAVFHQGWSAPRLLRCVLPAGLIGGFPAVFHRLCSCSRCGQRIGACCRQG